MSASDLGHSTLELSPAADQPPTVLERGPIDPNITVTAAQADQFVRERFPATTHATS